jgi:hypothetical protein
MDLPRAPRFTRAAGGSFSDPHNSSGKKRMGGATWEEVLLFAAAGLRSPRSMRW